MIILMLAVFGLILGSFVNALVWRVHEQASEHEKKRPSKKYIQQLSISQGRSICPHCHHQLAGKDLVPVLSWLYLRGHCRYCHKPISYQYPVVELATAGIFILSYVYWPVRLHGVAIAIFTLWLVELVGLIALFVYDLKWMLLPNRIMYPLYLLALAQAVLLVTQANKPLHALVQLILAVAIGGGLFYVLFQVSKGNWIGGGDVKLGWLLGLTAASASQSVLIIFFAAVGGTLLSLPLLVAGRLKQKSVIPFGPLLIIAAIIVRLFGVALWAWYQRLIGFGT